MVDPNHHYSEDLDTTFLDTGANMERAHASKPCRRIQIGHQRNGCT